MSSAWPSTQARGSLSRGRPGNADSRRCRRAGSRGALRSQDRTPRDDGAPGVRRGSRQRAGRRLTRARGPRQPQAPRDRREDPERGSQGRPDATDGRRARRLPPTSTQRQRRGGCSQRRAGGVATRTTSIGTSCVPPGPRALAAGRGVAALPGRETPHTLRRTYFSMMLEAGTSVPYVMGQVGTRTRIRRCGSTRRSSTVTARRSGRRSTR